MDLSSPQVIKQGSSYHVQHGTDAGLFVQFYMECLQDEEQSREQGRPIFFDREFIRIIPVGDKNTVVCRPVKNDYDGGTPPDKERWPAQYAAFKNQQIEVNEGTPITEWPPISKAQALSLKAVNVHTVESLAQVSDGNLHNIGMGARELREKAIAYLEQAKDGSGIVKLQEENKDLRLQIEALKNQIEALTIEKSRIPTFTRSKKGETQDA